VPNRPEYTRGAALACPTSRERTFPPWAVLPEKARSIFFKNEHLIFAGCSTIEQYRYFYTIIATFARSRKKRGFFFITRDQISRSNE
jgi:hypothetical protein